MLQCAVLIAQMKFVGMKMMLNCIIDKKGQLIIELWVSELGMIYRRADKEAVNWRPLPKFHFSKYHNFWINGRCANGFLYLLDNSQILTLEFLLKNLTHFRRPTSLERWNFDLFFVFKISMFAFELTNFSPETNGQR